MIDFTGMGVDLNQVVDLTTQVATSGALRLSEMVGDQVFEFTIGVVVVVQGAWGD